MGEVIIDDVIITIKGIAKLGKRWVLYATDAEVNAENFDEFLNLHNKYSSYGNYFKTIIEGQNFHGRFGQLIYCECKSCYKLRLYFVASEGDEEEHYAGFVSYDDVLFNNMSKMIAKQELTISNLIHVLVENKLLNGVDAKNLINHGEEDIYALRVKMSRQVDDLEKYLSSTHNTLSEIEERS